MPKVTTTGTNAAPYWLHKIDVILMRIDNEHKVIKGVKCKKVSKEHDLWEATVTLAKPKHSENSVFKSTSDIMNAVKDAVQNGIRHLRTADNSGEPFRGTLKSFLGWWNTPMYTFYTVSEASRIDGEVSNSTSGDLYPSIEKAAKQVADDINDYFEQEHVDKKVSAKSIVRSFNAKAKKFGHSAGLCSTSGKNPSFPASAASPCSDGITGGAYPRRHPGHIKGSSKGDIAWL